MNIKCYNVQVESLIGISDKAYKAMICNKLYVLPRSQVFGKDNESNKAYWIAAWLVEAKKFSRCSQKEAWFDSATGKQLFTCLIERHVPKQKAPVESNIISELIK
ncbi:MAG: hypothetical protein LBD45_00265 [Bacteroidales bacterium]|jgi:hypothetical protein|nr:hypothetical protein [Bacteroidales bacterium]